MPPSNFRLLVFLLEYPAEASVEERILTIQQITMAGLISSGVHGELAECLGGKRSLKKLINRS